MPSVFSPGNTSGFQELTLIANAGTLRLPLYTPKRDARNQKRQDLSGVWASGEGNLKDVPRRVHSFARGAGYSRKPPGYGEQTEWDAFADSKNMCTRFGYAIPSGEQTSETPTAAWGKIQKEIWFNGDLFYIFLNRVAYKDDGTGAFNDLYFFAGDTFHDAEVYNGGLRVANICTHTGSGAGQHHSFASITYSGGSYHVIQPDETYIGGIPFQASLLETVFWEYQGVANLRLAGKVSDTQFRYMIVSNGDPYDPLNWGPAVTVGESTFEINSLVASHDTLWAVKRDGVYAITDKNASAGGENLTPYFKHQLDPVSAPPEALYFQDKLIVSRPLSLEAIDVNSWQVQDAPRPIGISFGRSNDTRLNGRYTALGSDNGYLLAAMKGIDGAATVLYGAPRQRESPVAGVTEYDWWPEIGPIPDREITALYVHTPEATLRPALHIGMMDTSGNPYLMIVDLFRGASPLSDTGHRYHTLAEITNTDEQWQSRMAAKGALVGTVAVRNIDGDNGRSVDVEVIGGAGEPFIGTPTFSVTTFGTEVAHAGLHNTISRAHVVRSKLTIHCTATSPVVIDEFELRAHLGFPLRKRGSWLLELSDASVGNSPDTTHAASADELLAVILAEGMEVMLAKMPDGSVQQVVLDNILPYRDEDRDDAEARTKVLEVAYTVVS